MRGYRKYCWFYCMVLLSTHGKKIYRQFGLSKIKMYKKTILTDPLRPGKLKNTSGPFRCGICRKTVNSFAE